MIHSVALSNTKAMNGSDLNANAWIGSLNFMVLQSTTQSVDVYGFDESFGEAENIPIVTVATMFDCQS